MEGNSEKGELDLRESRHPTSGGRGLLPGVDIAPTLAEGTVSVELASTAENAAAAKPEASEPRCVGSRVR